MGIVGYAYGGLLVFGGVMGYAMARSLPSLAAGGGIGLAVVALEAAQAPTGGGTSDVACCFAQATLSGAVAAHMFSTSTKSFSPRPLVLSAISAAATLYFLSRATAPARKKL
jgi:uncharacterized membrane protein (UPF0136 family)